MVTDDVTQNANVSKLTKEMVLDCVQLREETYSDRLQIFRVVTKKADTKNNYFSKTKNLKDAQAN